MNTVNARIEVELVSPRFWRAVAVVLAVLGMVLTKRTWEKLAGWTMKKVRVRYRINDCAWQVCQPAGGQLTDTDNLALLLTRKQVDDAVE